MTEQQWTQLSAELKAAETSGKIFDQLVTRIRQLDAAIEASEVPEKSESTPPVDDSTAASDTTDAANPSTSTEAD
jgi:hypothetical protein